jgi:hypothetical protein
VLHRGSPAPEKETRRFMSRDREAVTAALQDFLVRSERCRFSGKLQDVLPKVREKRALDAKGRFSVAPSPSGQLDVF